MARSHKDGKMESEFRTRVRSHALQFSEALLFLVAQAIVSLPLAFVVMLASIFLFAPGIVKGDPSTWAQTIAQYHALHVPFGTAVYGIARLLQRFFLAAWFVALIARLAVVLHGQNLSQRRSIPPVVCHGSPMDGQTSKEPL